MVCCAFVGLMSPGLVSTDESEFLACSGWLTLLLLSSFSDGSYIIVLCSKLLRSNIRTLPSAPQLTKTSILLAQNRTSKTSLSWAINCVFAVRDGISHIVHVVSILDVMIRLGDRVFQSREVRGAVCSGDFEFDSKASACSFGAD